MTAVKITIFSFSCDQPGCREVVEIMPDLPFLSYAARQLREREDWATGQGKYFCPAHKRPLRSAGLTGTQPLVTLVVIHPAGASSPLMRAWRCMSCQPSACRTAAGAVQ
jgi:hypothetical protein